MLFRLSTSLHSSRQYHQVRYTNSYIGFLSFFCTVLANASSSTSLGSSPIKCFQRDCPMLHLPHLWDHLLLQQPLCLLLPYVSTNSSKCSTIHWLSSFIDSPYDSIFFFLFKNIGARSEHLTASRMP